MGRYYWGDIEGKFWFGVQSSSDVENLINITAQPGNMIWHGCGCVVDFDQKYNEYCKERGNRLATVLCYLNHVKKGGGTGFDKLQGRSEPLIIQPVKGRMVVFQNVHDDGSLHEESRHAGLPRRRR